MWVIINILLLKIKKTESGPWSPGQTYATYSIDVENFGGRKTTSPTTIIDTLPTGIVPDWTNPWVVVGNNAKTFTCNAIGQTVTCTTPDLFGDRTTSNAQPASNSNFSLPIRVTAAASASVTNYASVGNPSDPDALTPPAPGASCTDTLHCAQATSQVIVARPDNIAAPRGSVVNVFPLANDTLPAGAAFAQWESGLGGAPYLGNPPYCATAPGFSSSSLVSGTAPFYAPASGSCTFGYTIGRWHSYSINKTIKW